MCIIRNLPKFRDEVKNKTKNGKGVDIVYDPIGGPTSLGKS